MIIDAFQKIAATFKDRIAINHKNQCITYQHLDTLSGHLAAAVRAVPPKNDNKNRNDDTITHQTTPQRSAGLLLTHGIHQVIGLLAVLKAGDIYVPLDPQYPRERLHYMTDNAGISLLITDRENATLARQLAESFRDRQIHLLVMNESNGPTIDENKYPESKHPPITPTDDPIAYILYTSGSTGKPRGVPQTRRGVRFYTENYVNALSIGPSDRVSYLSSFSHDGAIQDIYCAILSGAALCPLDIRSDSGAARVGQWLADQCITFYHSVPTVFRFAAATITGGVFPSVRLMVTGGEKLRPDDVALARRLFPNATVGHMYGQSESSVNTMGFVGGTEKITLGTPLPGVELLLLNEEGEEVEPYEVGEIFVACAHIAPGYWRAPEATAKAFLEDEDLGRLYRTGDLGKIDSEGRIEFLGRKDHQVKIRGFRVELPEIEDCLKQYPGVGETVVTARETKDGERVLCAYIVPDDADPQNHKQKAIPDRNGPRNFLAERLPDYMVPVYFVFLDRMPVTPTGKTDRRALPEPQHQEEDGTHVAPSGPIETQLQALWAEVLGLDEADISANADFFTLGGHSLKAAVLSARIEKHTGIKLPLAEIFRCRTIASLARFIDAARPGEGTGAIPPAEKREYYPQSAAQKRLFLLDRMGNTGTAYIISHTLELKDPMDDHGLQTLQNTFRALIDRHETLRTSFHMIGNQPVQKIHDNVAFSIHQSTAPFSPGQRVFDLAVAPLLRVAYRETEHGGRLFFDMHHIIGDGTSMGILLADFARLHAGDAPPALNIQYKDYAVWQDRPARGGERGKQAAHWLKLFPPGEDVPRLNLPLDFPGPPEFDFAGDDHRFSVDPVTASGLRTLAAESGATLYMTLLAALSILFYKITGQRDMVLGSAVHGRTHADLGPLIGMFVNMVALRLGPAGDMTGPQYLDQVKHRSIGALENQDHPFAELVETIEPTRDLSRNPLFDVTFQVQDFGPAPAPPPGLTMAARSAENYTENHTQNRTAKFDLAFFAVEGRGGEIAFAVEYRTSLFLPDTIRRLTGYFLELLRNWVADPGGTLGALQILSDDERRRLLVEFNETHDPHQPYATDDTLHGLFRARVEAAPDPVALAGATGHLTYRLLDRESDHVAAGLLARGVRAGDIIALSVDRSQRMILGILGILKAGACYLPLDPHGPAGRREYVLKDSGAEKILTAADMMPGEPGRVSENPRLPVHSSRLPAYVIYTSGTTGRPRGVVVEHGHVSPLLHWGYQCLVPGRVPHRVLQNVSYYFDWSVWEMFITLTSGAVLVQVPGEALMEPGRAAGLMQKHAVDVFHVTPGQWGHYLGYYFKTDFNAGPGGGSPALAYLFLGGERLPVDMVERSFRLLGDGCRIFNMYGLTETAVISTTLGLRRGDLEGYRGLTGVPLGPPIANTALWVLDRDLNPCPVNIAGELYISGDGTARGYLNKPELTHERFLKRPLHRFHLCRRSYRTTYKTGDLVRWLPRGDLEFIGRADHQVKIRGYRIELGEIENQLLKHPALKSVVVLDREDRRGNRYLCAYVVGEVPGGVPDGGDLGEFLGRELPDYMVPSAWVSLDALPLTPNGKVDRAALPVPGVEAQTHQPPRNEREKQLAVLWARVLGHDEQSPPIGIDDHFFRLGGHSLTAAVLVSAIRGEMGIDVPLAEIFRTGTIRGLSARLEKGDPGAAPLEPVEDREYYDLSWKQQWLWEASRKVSGSSFFNISGGVPLRHRVDAAVVRRVLQRLVDRHESLRTAFVVVGGRVRQIIRARVDAEPGFLDMMDISALDGEAKQKARRDFFHKIGRTPFDFSRAPLVRWGLLKGGEEQYELMFGMHHLISDGWTLVLLEREFSRLYNDGEENPEPVPQYRDYSQWVNRGLESPAGRASRRYWESVLGNGIPEILPRSDFPRKPGDVNGAGYRSVLGGDVRQGLLELARTHDTGLFMVMLAVFLAWLPRYFSFRDSGEAVCWIVSSGRERHPALQGIVGFFTNLVLYKMPMETAGDFGRFLGEVRRGVREALDHQDYPLAGICENLGVAAPEIPTAFNFLDLLGGGGVGEMPGLESGPVPGANDVKFDFEVYVTEYGDGIEMYWTYRAGMYRPETAAAMIGDYTERLKALAP